MAQTSPTKIIASLEAKKAQEERLAAEFQEREKNVTEKITALLVENNCMLNAPVVVDPLFGIRSGGFVVVAKERLQ